MTASVLAEEPKRRGSRGLVFVSHTSRLKGHAEVAAEDPLTRHRHRNRLGDNVVKRATLLSDDYIVLRSPGVVGDSPLEETMDDCDRTLRETLNLSSSDTAEVILPATQPHRIGPVQSHAGSKPLRLNSYIGRE